MMRLRRLWAWFVDPIGRWPRVAITVACALIVTMYCTNHDMGGDPDSPRGDGTYRPVLARGDGHMMYLMARSTALDGDWVFDNDLARFGDPWGQPRTKTGRKSIAHPIGPPLVWTPLIWIAEAGAAVVDELGGDIELHGYTLWHQRFVFLSSALFACAAVVLGRRLASRLVGGSWAPTYAAIGVLLATPLTYYATYMPSYAHAMDAFTCGAFLYYWAVTIGRSDLRRYIILGALLGLATLIRVQELAMGIVVAIEVIDGVIRSRKLALRWLACGVLVLAVAGVVFIPQLLEWHLVFGSVTELPQGARYTRLEAPMIGELLFSPRNGWFSTTPIAYLATIGLALLPRRAGLARWGLVAAVAIQVYLNSTILDWWGSAAFGQRRMCNVSLPLVVGLATLIWRLGRLVRLPRPAQHTAAVVVIGVFCAWNLNKVWQLRGGKPAPSELAPTCCANLGPLSGFASSVYGVVGNPFEFPANAYFAARHGVSMSRWDHTVGNYPFIPPLDTLLDDRLWKQRGKWAIGSSGMQPYLLGSWSGVIGGPHAARWTIGPSAGVLVPNLMPYDQRATLWLGPSDGKQATVKWNGDVVARTDALTSWTSVSFDIGSALHTNELVVETDAGEDDHGILVGELDLAFDH